MQAADSKTKRIFADVPASTANQFLATARLQGTTGQALVAGWVDRYLVGDMDAHAKVSGNTIESVMRSGNSTAISLVKAALQAAVELCASPLAQGTTNSSDPYEDRVSAVIEEAARLKANPEGNVASRKRDGGRSDESVTRRRGR